MKGMLYEEGKDHSRFAGIVIGHSDLRRGNENDGWKLNVRMACFERGVGGEVGGRGVTIDSRVI